MWLFVVFILTASYTASLSSRFIVRNLEPEIDIDWLKRNNQKVGCDGDSFVMRYLEQVLEFKKENIYNVSNEYDYKEQFAKKNIAAAFLELPYQKVFLNKYCNGFTSTAQTYRFGGLGFVSIVLLFIFLPFSSKIFFFFHGNRHIYPELFVSKISCHVTYMRAFVFKF